MTTGRLQRRRGAALWALGWRALLFTAVLLVIYFPLAEAGFVGDYLGWKIRVDEGGLAGAAHTYDFPGHLQVYAAMMWATEQLRRVSPQLVQIALCSLGGFGAALAALFFEREARRIGIATAGAIGIGAALLWVCSPGMTEVFVYKICQHYLLTVAVWFGALLLAGDYLHHRRARLRYALWGLQLVGVFSLEFSYALPLVLAVYLGWRQLCARGDARAADWLTLVAVPMAIAFLHPLATRLYYGVWIGHYGEEVATALPIDEIAAAPWRWMGRYFLFTRYWGPGLRTSFNELLRHPLALVALYGSALALAGALVRGRFRENLRDAAPAWQLALVFLAMAGLAAAPVAQLYFFDLHPIEGSRLGTLMYLFAGAASLTLLSHLGRVALHGFLAAGLLSSVYVLQTPLEAWRTSQATLEGLVASARGHLATARAQGAGAGVEVVANPNDAARSEATADYPTDTVFLLGYVNVVRGAALLVNTDPLGSGFGHYVEVMHPETPWPHFVEVAQFNQQSRTDTVNADWGDDRLYVSLDADGAWWWRHQRGLAGFEDPVYDYRVEVEEWHFEVLLGESWRGREPACWHQEGRSWSVVAGR